MVKDGDFEHLDTSSPKHVILPEHDGSVMIVGDIHGCYDEFQELLELYWNSQDVLILAGDLVMLCQCYLLHVALPYTPFIVKRQAFVS